MYHTNSTLYPKNVPIAKLEALQALYRKHGIQVRYRFRGPRRRLAHQSRTTATWRCWGGLECLRENAVGFSVYPDNRGHWDDRCVKVTYFDLPERPTVYIKSNGMTYVPIPRGRIGSGEIIERSGKAGRGYRSISVRAPCA